MGSYNPVTKPTHTQPSSTFANMGTKLSKTENKETNVKDGEVKIVDLENEAATTTTTTNDEVENDKTLKGDSFDRSSGFSKSLRKSMRKIVGKKKKKKEKKKKKTAGKKKKKKKKKKK